jgi:hypothetical protein
MMGVITELNTAISTALGFVVATITFIGPRFISFLSHWLDVHDPEYKRPAHLQKSEREEDE